MKLRESWGGDAKGPTREGQSFKGPLAIYVRGEKARQTPDLKEGGKKPGEGWRGPALPVAAVSPLFCLAECDSGKADR